jgi:hypothetical protein
VAGSALSPRGDVAGLAYGGHDRLDAWVDDARHIKKTVTTFQPGPQLNELLASSATMATSGRPNKA